MNKNKVCFIFLISGIIFSSCAQVSDKRALFSSQDHDVVLEATPFKVKGITGESVVDAVEEGFEEPGFDSAVVLFKIEKVLSGEFSQMRAGGPSKFQQMKDAARDGDFWKLVKSDFTDPDEMVDQKWVSIAVSDPKTTFGFPTWGSPVDEPYKLYLKRQPDQPHSYILVKSQLKS
jgi:hypothetical protein